MKATLKEFCLSLGIEEVGIAHIGPYIELEKIWRKRIEAEQITGFEEKDIYKRIDPRLTLPDAKSIIVCLFPYLPSQSYEANLSKSSISIDYHHIVKDKLEKIAFFLESKIYDFHYKAYVDNGPLIDRHLAYIAGLGYFGINSHIINDKYGSYVFIGYIISNYPFTPDKPLERTCMKCGLCIKCCPGCAILGNFDINPLLCRSYITQKKDILSDTEVQILKKDHLIFGCDICQDVCPHNKNINTTTVKEFEENLKWSLDCDELTQISNKEFARRYKNRAFSWRGKNLLIRNFNTIRDIKNPK